jgi:hypothetical protein
MKKGYLILMSALLMLTSTVVAQDSNFSFGLRAGFNMQNINGKDRAGDKLTMELVPRFNAGVIAGIPVAPDFYFEPGLFFAAKGAKSSNQFLGIDMSVEYNLSYLELPLSFVYKPVLGNGKFFLGFGPYVGYGLSGKAKFNVAGVKTDDKIVFDNEYLGINPYDWKHFKHFDYGGNLFFGYELASGISLQLNTQLGLAKVNSKNNLFPGNKSEFRNTGFGLALGYNF